MKEHEEQLLPRIAGRLLVSADHRARTLIQRRRLDAGELFRRSGEELAAHGFSAEEIRRLHRYDFSAAENEVARCREAGIELISRDDADFPPLLGQIHEPPDYIYFKGNRECLQAAKLAVVGSRRASSYGLAAGRRLLPAVCRAGVALVSGMAYGIDSLAHRIAVEENAVTIGVNAGGLLHLYPQGNRALIERIVEHGGVISEFPLDTVPRPHLFPVRNRLIAGLARAVLVIEAAMRSGSLITARLALEENRDVLAVPGNIDSDLSSGTNYLLAQGAKVVTGVRDILEEYGLEPAAVPIDPRSLSPGERQILDLLGENELKGIDYFCDHLQWNTAETITTMMGLVLKNIVCEEAGLFRRVYHG